jgi:hypothetical protein
MNRSSPTRRDFLEALAVTGAAIGAVSMFGAVSIPPEAMTAAAPCRSGVVSFHMDQPYIDATGTAPPYRPPHGARSAAAVAHLSEKAFLSEHFYV